MQQKQINQDIGTEIIEKLKLLIKNQEEKNGRNEPKHTFEINN